MRSPSQWPGTARSSASAGRSLIITSGVTNPLAARRVARPGDPQRSPGAQAGDELTGARLGPGRRAPGRSPRARSACVSSSGKSTRSRFAICSGLHAVAHRRSCAASVSPTDPPHLGGPATGSPSGRSIMPARRSCTYSRSRSLATSFAVFGRRARRSACHCAVDARYSSRHVRGRRVAPQLPRDRRRRPAELAGDLAHPEPLRVQDRDLLTLGERQVAARHRRRARSAHATSVPEPSRPDRRRHADLQRPRPRSTALGDRRPEPHPVLASPAAAAPATASGPASARHHPLTLPHRHHAPPPSIEVLRRPLESALGAVVGVGHGLARGWPAPPERHLDGVDDELGTDVVGDRPAHDSAAEGVEDHGQVHLAVAGGVLGDVHHPQPVRPGRGRTGGRRDRRWARCRRGGCSRLVADGGSPRRRLGASAARPACANSTCPAPGGARRAPAGCQRTVGTCGGSPRWCW